MDTVQGLPPYVFVMLGLYAGLRREEILALKWDAVYLDGDFPYLAVRRAWHTENNRPVILDELKTKAAERNIPLPTCLAECLKEAKANSTSEYVVANRDSNIGINKLESLLRSPRCPFVLYVGKKKLVKRKEFEKFITDNIEI